MPLPARAVATTTLKRQPHTRVLVSLGCWRDLSISPSSLRASRHGEYSGKDYEAVISKAVLLKPLARHLASFPEIYRVNSTCAEVRPGACSLPAALV